MVTKLARKQTQPASKTNRRSCSPARHVRTRNMAHPVLSRAQDCHGRLYFCVKNAGLPSFVLKEPITQLVRGLRISDYNCSSVLTGFTLGTSSRNPGIQAGERADIPDLGAAQSSRANARDGSRRFGPVRATSANHPITTKRRTSPGAARCQAEMILKHIRTARERQAGLVRHSRCFD
jgi:hypothetical protein